MLHPTEQYGQIVVVTVVSAILVGAAWASGLLKLSPRPLAATVAPVVFRNPRLVMFMLLASSQRNSRTVVKHIYVIPWLALQAHFCADHR